MNWDALAAIGEVTGAVAVVISLAYLAVQIRQNTKSVEAATFQSVAEGLADAAYRLANAHNQDSDRLLLFVATIRRYENLHFQMRRGNLIEEDVSGFFSSLAGFLGGGDYLEYWSLSRPIFHPEFVSYVDTSVVPRIPEFHELRARILEDNPESAA